MKISGSSKGYEESDGASEKGAPRSITDPGIGRFRDRLKEAIGGEGVRPFSKRVGISEGSIFSYLSGQTFPSLDRLDAICNATSRPAYWFVSDDAQLQTAEGRAGYGSHALRSDVLKMVIEAIDDELRLAKQSISTEVRARAYTLGYDIVIEAGEALPMPKVVQLAIRAAFAA